MIQARTIEIFRTNKSEAAKMLVAEITLEIATPKGLFTGVFPKTAKIEDVIQAAVDELGIDSGDRLDLVRDGQVLEPVQRTLVSFGLTGTVQLELVATGSGV